MKKLKSILNKKALFAALALTGFSSTELGASAIQVTDDDGTSPVADSFITYENLQTALVAMLSDPATYKTLPNALLSALTATQSTATGVIPLSSVAFGNSINSAVVANASLLSKIVWDGIAASGVTVSANAKDAFFYLSEEFGTSGSVSLEEYFAQVDACTDFDITNINANNMTAIKKAIRIQATDFLAKSVMTVTQSAATAAFDSALSDIQASSSHTLYGSSFKLTKASTKAIKDALTIGADLSLQSVIELITTTNANKYVASTTTGSGGIAASVLTALSNDEVLYLRAKFAEKLLESNDVVKGVFIFADTNLTIANLISGVNAKAFDLSGPLPTALNQAALISGIKTALTSNGTPATYNSAIDRILDANAIKIAYNEPGTNTITDVSATNAGKLAHNIKYQLFGMQKITISPVTCELFTLVDNFLNRDDIKAMNLKTTTATTFKSQFLSGTTMTYSQIVDLVNAFTPVNTSDANLTDPNLSNFRNRFASYLAQSMYPKGIQLSDVAAAGYAKEADLAGKVNSGSTDLKLALDAVYATEASLAAKVQPGQTPAATNLKTALDAVYAPKPVSGSYVTEAALIAQYSSATPAPANLKAALDAVYAEKPTGTDAYVLQSGLDAAVGAFVTSTANPAPATQAALDAVYAKSTDLRSYGLKSLGTTVPSTETGATGLSKWSLNGLDKDVATLFVTRNSDGTSNQILASGLRLAYAQNAGSHSIEQNPPAGQGLTILPEARQ